jgi:hypothetical protein
MKSFSILLRLNISKIGTATLNYPILELAGGCLTARSINLGGIKIRHQIIIDYYG